MAAILAAVCSRNAQHAAVFPPPSTPASVVSAPPPSATATVFTTPTPSHTPPPSPTPTADLPPPRLDPVALIGGRIQAVAVRGDVAIVGHRRRLLALDIGRPEAIAVIAESPPLDALIVDVAWVDDRLYVVTEDGAAVLAVDLAEAKDLAVATPRTVLEEPGEYYHRLRTSGNRLYVAASGTAALHILDLSVPNQPRPMGRVAVPADDKHRPEFLLDVQVDEAHGLAYGYGYINITYPGRRDVGGRLVVIDVANPAEPRWLGSTDTALEGEADRLVEPGSLQLLDGDRLVLSDWSTGARVFDVSQPREPQLVGAIDTAGAALAAWNGLLVQAGWSGLRAYRMNEAVPTVVWEHLDQQATQSAGTPMIAADRLVLPTDRGLAVLDLGQEPRPQLLGLHEVGPADALSVATVGGLVAVGGKGTLTLLNVDDPARPQVISQLGGFSRIVGLIERDGFLYVLQRELHASHPYVNQLKGVVVDVRTPESPRRLRDERAMALLAVAEDGRAFGSDGDQLIVPLDLARAAVPSGTPVTAKTYATYALAASGDYLVVSGGYQVLHDIVLHNGGPGIQIVDVHDPLTMTMRGSMEGEPVGNDLAVVGGDFLAFTGMQLRRLDLSNPDAPAWAETIALDELPGPNGARLGGDTLKVLPFGRHLLVLTTDQLGVVTGEGRQRRLAAVVAVPSEVSDMAIAPDHSHVYVAAGDDGLWILSTR